MRGSLRGEWGELEDNGDAVGGGCGAHLIHGVIVVEEGARGGIARYGAVLAIRTTIGGLHEVRRVGSVRSSKPHGKTRLRKTSYAQSDHKSLNNLLFLANRTL